VKALVESFVKSEELLTELLRYYGYVICEGCKSYDSRILLRKTVRGWRGIKSKKLVFVVSDNLNEFRLAARNRFVDVISFGKKSLRFLDVSEANLIDRFGKAIEIRVNELLEHEKSLGDLKRAINILLDKWVPTLFTCAPSSLYEICHPYQIIALINTFGYDESEIEALWSLGSNWALSRYESKGRG